MAKRTRIGNKINITITFEPDVAMMLDKRCPGWGEVSKFVNELVKRSVFNEREYVKLQLGRSYVEYREWQIKMMQLDGSQTLSGFIKES